MPFTWRIAPTTRAAVGAFGGGSGPSPPMIVGVDAPPPRAKTNSPAPAPGPAVRWPTQERDRYFTVVLLILSRMLYRSEVQSPEYVGQESVAGLSNDAGLRPVPDSWASSTRGTAHTTSTRNSFASFIIVFVISVSPSKQSRYGCRHPSISEAYQCGIAEDCEQLRSSHRCRG